MSPRYEKVRSLSEANLEQKEKYKTTHQTVADFRLKNHVRVICLIQDYYHWNGETGHVIKIQPKNVNPITIKFDHPINVMMPDDSVFEMTTFSFQPDDLITFKKLKELKKIQEIEDQLGHVRSQFNKRKGKV